MEYPREEGQQNLDASLTQRLAISTGNQVIKSTDQSAPLINRRNIRLRTVFFRKRKRKLSPSSSEVNWQHDHRSPSGPLKPMKTVECDRGVRRDMNRSGIAKSGLLRPRTREPNRLIIVLLSMLVCSTAATMATATEANKQAQVNNKQEGAKQLASLRVASTALTLGGDSPANIKTSSHHGAALDITSQSRTRWKRAAQSAELIHVVAVSGQWIELQCPLVSELMSPSAPSGAESTSAPSGLKQHSIQWRKNGVRLDQLNPRYKINPTNGSLVIANSQPKVDEANYECWLVRKKDDTDEAEPLMSHRLELRLIVPPRVAPFEFPADAQVGMKLVLTCSVLEGHQPISFVWLKDNKIIGGDGQRASAQASSLSQLHQQQLADKYALFPIPYSLARSGQRAEYVLAQSSNSTTSSSFKKESAEESDLNQQTALLPLLTDSNIRIRMSDDYSILSIERLELKHSGRYTCSVQNEAARTSHSSQLLINAPPTLTTVPKDMDLVSGQSAVIECAASGQPRPTISWLRARETESSSKQWDYVPVYDNLRYTSLSNGSLAIGNITLREQGFYLCSSKNPFGTEMSKLAKISVHEPAKFSTKYKTVEVRIEESASLLCVATGELPVTIEWRNKDDNLIEANDKRFIIDHEPQDLAKSPSELVANLINATVSRLIVAKSQRSDSGHYSCHAKNKFGSDKMVTNLLVQDVPDKVTDLKVTNTTSSSIFLRWQLAFTGNSPITSYLVQYEFDDPLDDLLVSMGTTNNVNANNQQQPRLKSDHLDGGADLIGLDKGGSTSPLRVALEALSVPGSSVDSVVDDVFDRTLIEQTVEQSATHLLVKDLSPFCVYRLRLAAINKIGLGEFSDWIRAKTEEAPPGGSASRIVAAATGPNSIKVTWSPPDRRAWNGQLTGFNIGYRPIDSTFELNKTIEWSPPSLQSMVMDARNKQLSSGKTDSKPAPGRAESQPLAADTDKRPQVVSNKESSNSTGSSKATDQRHSLRQHLRQLLALQQQELVAHLTNLQRSTTYLLWIQAINSRGLGPQSHAVSIKTLDDVPPSAPAIKIQATSTSSITIAWSMLSNFVSSANQYSLFYRRVTTTPPVRQSNPSNSSPSSLENADDLQQQSRYLQHNLADLAQPQPQPFIERTITSQQLVAGQNTNLNIPLVGGDFIDQSNVETMSKLIHHQQHYQQFVYTLDQLDCGSLYELYMSTRNSVGKSEPSAMVSTRTLGEAPSAPINKNNFFSRIGINEVALNLAAWSTGGCPLTHMTVRYKQSPMPVASNSGATQPIANQPLSGNSSSAVSASAMSVTWPITTSVPVALLNALNSHQLQQTSTNRGHFTSDLLLKNESPVYYLKNLMPASCYELEVVAYNTAGHTSAQYEFVTSNSNGTLAGYSRREGVYRIEQADLAHEQLFAPVDGRASIEQQMQAYKQASSSQILPLLVMALCLVCLIISSVFCYNRLSGSWKAQRGRRNSNDTCSRANGPANSSPASVGGKSSMWGNVGDSSGRYVSALPAMSARNLQPDGSGDRLHGADSPATTMHYCMREPLAGNQAMNPKSTAPSTSFSQSVSMKDFNVLASQNAGPKLSTGTATLNYKNYRATLRQPTDGYKTATLRARLFSDQAGQSFFGQSRQDSQQLVCHDLTLCKRPIRQDCSSSAQNYAHLSRNAAGQAEPDGTGQVSGPSEPYSTHQFNYTQDNQQLQQETSWTNHYHGQCIEQQNSGAAYAVPAPAANYEQQLNSNYATTRQATLDQSQTIAGLPANHDQTSIDACIQQLIGQQQYQQQPYSMVMNFKTDRCLHSDSLKMTDVEHDCKQQQTVACPAPFIDSSSSSSGVDVGNHLECASTTTGTSNSNSNSNSNASNETNYHQLPDNSSRPPNNYLGSNELSASEHYTLQNVMQQFNEPA